MDMHIWDVLEPNANYLEALPAYQRNTIEKLLENGLDYEDAANVWLSANGPANTFPFGAEVKKNLFVEKLKDEVGALMCNEEKYVEERKEIIAKCKGAGSAIITIITAYLAPVVGATPALILPAVALIFNVISKIGVNAWCAYRIESSHN